MIVVEERQTSRQFSSLNVRLPNSKEVGIGYYKEKAVYMVSAMLDIKLTAKRPLGGPVRSSKSCDDAAEEAIGSS